MISSDFVRLWLELDGKNESDGTIHWSLWDHSAGGSTDLVWIFVGPRDMGGELLMDSRGQRKLCEVGWPGNALSLHYLPLPGLFSTVSRKIP